MESSARRYQRSLQKGVCQRHRYRASSLEKSCLLTIKKHQEHKGEKYTFTKVIEVTERKTDRNGQVLLVPEVTGEGWWTNLDFSEAKIIRLYQNHGLSEQVHSEFKTDLDLERLPGGKFATNGAVMALGVFAYNILRLIGQLGLLGKNSPIRHPGKRRRLKTVIQELIYLAARFKKSGRRLRFRFGKHCPAYQAFADLYGRILVGG